MFISATQLAALLEVVRHSRPLPDTLPVPFRNRNAVWAKYQVPVWTKKLGIYKKSHFYGDDDEEYSLWNIGDQPRIKHSIPSEMYSLMALPSKKAN